MTWQVAGIDGCKGGWVVARAIAQPRLAVAVARVERLRDVVGSPELAAVAVDIPIGLSGMEPRACDREARRLLGPRRSSVFPAPLRSVLDASTWEEANARSRAASGRGMSRQAFGILDKVREADAVVTPDLQMRVVEAHPELAFALLAGAPMRHHKSTAAGREERLTALAAVVANIEDISAVRPGGARADDVLDAVVLAWTARRFLLGAHTALGDGTVDARGLRMEIVA